MKIHILRFIIICALLEAPFVCGNRGIKEVGSIPDPNRPPRPSSLRGDGIKGIANVDTLHVSHSLNAQVAKSLPTAHLRGAGSSIGRRIVEDGHQFRANNSDIVDDAYRAFDASYQADKRITNKNVVAAIQGHENDELLDNAKSTGARPRQLRRQRRRRSPRQHKQLSNPGSKSTESSTNSSNSGAASKASKGLSSSISQYDPGLCSRYRFRRHRRSKGGVPRDCSESRKSSKKSLSSMPLPVPIAVNDLFIHSSSGLATKQDVADGCVLENDKDIDIGDVGNLVVCVVNGTQIQNDIHQHVDLGQHTKMSIGADGCFTMSGLATEYQNLPKGETADVCFSYQACDGHQDISSNYKSNVAEACVRVEGVAEDPSIMSSDGDHVCIKTGEVLYQDNGGGPFGRWTFGITEDNQVNLWTPNNEVVWTFCTEVSHLCIGEERDPRPDKYSNQRPYLYFYDEKTQQIVGNLTCDGTDGFNGENLDRPTILKMVDNSDVGMYANYNITVLKFKKGQTPDPGDSNELLNITVAKIGEDMVGSLSFNEDKCTWNDVCLRTPVISEPRLFTSLFDPRLFSFQYGSSTVTFSGPFKTDGENNVTFSGPDGEQLNDITITTVEIASDDDNRVLFVLDEESSSIKAEIYTPDGGFSIFDFSEQTYGDLIKLAFPDFNYSASFAFETKLSNSEPNEERRKMKLSSKERLRSLDRYYYRSPRPDTTIQAGGPHAYANFFIERCEGFRFKPYSIDIRAFLFDSLVDSGSDSITDKDVIQLTPLEVGEGIYQGRVPLDDGTTDVFLRNKKVTDAICEGVGKAMDFLCLLNKWTSTDKPESYIADPKGVAICAGITALVIKGSAYVGTLAAKEIYATCEGILLGLSLSCEAHGQGTIYRREESPIVKACKFDSGAFLYETLFPDRVFFSADVNFYKDNIFGLSDDYKQTETWNPETDGFKGPDTTFTAPDAAVLASFDVPDFVVPGEGYEACAIVDCVKNDPKYNTVVSIFFQRYSPTQQHLPIIAREVECSHEDLIASRGVCVLEISGGNVGDVDEIRVTLTETFNNGKPRIVEEFYERATFSNSVCGRRLTTYFEDADTDGFGNPNVSIEACAVPPEGNWVENHLDCDDENADVGICNGIDGCEHDGDCPSNSACIDGTCVLKGNPRFTLSWTGDDDLDLHVIPPGGQEIYFNHKIDSVTNGYLDTDIIPESPGTWVENVNVPTGPDGTYTVWVHQYTQVGASDPFKLEFVEDATSGDPGLVIHTYDGSAGLGDYETTPFLLYLKPDGGVVEMLQP